MSFAEGDRVRFKGDPDEVDYVLSNPNGDGSWDLSPVEPQYRIHSPEYIPERLLERVPEKVCEGDVWQHRWDGHLIFITDVNGNHVRYTATRGVVVDGSASGFTNGNYDKVFPAP